MREIKFRAAVKETGEVFPVLTIWDNSVCLDTTRSRYEWDCKVYSNEEIILLQYTGLKDINGTEIYEGDIVRIYGGEYWYGYWEVDIRGEVVFDVFSFGVKSKDRFYPFNYAFEPYDHKIKVIGNIYENPKLLEREE